MKKEESLSKAERELEACARELTHTKEVLRDASNESSGLRKDLQELQKQFLELEAQRYGCDVSGEAACAFLHFYFMPSCVVLGRVYIRNELTE